ncbi:hypothetical protein C8J56DRAFT_1094301 [Mycena floridula]|nr:hypothetical protein C8J56DRAFT_1094301 [Mycena floridula]
MHSIEKSLFWGQLTMTWLYGIACFVFVYSTHLLISSRHASRSYIIFAGILLLLQTIYVFKNAVVAQMMWIDHRDAPGGPVGYLLSIVFSGWNIFGNVTGPLLNILADGLLLYRCYVIYDGSWKLLIGPFFIYLGSTAMDITLEIEAALAGSHLSGGTNLVHHIGTTWAVLSVSLNIIVTALIAFRLLKAHRIEAINTYTSIVAILVESALPFSILGIAFAVTFGANIVEGAALVLVWTGLSALSPQFIIFRIASGRAWTRRVSADISALRADIANSDTLNAKVEKLMTEGSFQAAFGNDGVTRKISAAAARESEDSFASSIRSVDSA